MNTLIYWFDRFIFLSVDCFFMFKYDGQELRQFIWNEKQWNSEEKLEVWQIIIEKMRLLLMG